MKKKQKPYIRERDIWMVDLDPTVGIEIQKTRPCLILRVVSKYHVVIIPITSQEQRSNAILLSKIHFLKHQEGYLKPLQIRAVDTQRLHRHLGKISSNKFLGIQKKSAELLRILPR